MTIQAVQVLKTTLENVRVNWQQLQDQDCLQVSLLVDSHRFNFTVPNEQIENSGNPSQFLSELIHLKSIEFINQINQTLPQPEKDYELIPLI